MVDKWGQLGDAEADNLNGRFEEKFQEFLSGQPEALQACFQILEALLNGGSDYFEEILEELPQKTPASFTHALLNYHSESGFFVGEVLAILPRYLAIDQSDLRKMMSFTDRPFAGGHEWIDSQCGRATVAINIHATQDLLLELASDLEWENRFRVALHPNITAEIATKILSTKELGDPSLESLILTGLASNTKLDSETLMLLASHPDRVVRTGVKLNQSTPEDVRLTAESFGTDDKLPSNRLSWWEYF